MQSEKKYTAEEIEKLKQKDPKDLTPYERGLSNLTPIKKGEVRNPNGRKKGAKNWSTYFQKLLNDEEFLSTIIKNLPSSWNDTVEKYPASVIAAGLITTATQSVAKAVAEGRPIDDQTLKTLDRIQKFTFGDKVVHEDPDGIFNKTEILFEVVPSLREKEDDES